MKQGFLVYFDNCRQTKELEDHQYAALWKTVFAYAEKLAGNDADAEAYLNGQISAAPAGMNMALRFITDNVRRDHLRYEGKAAQYRAAQQHSGRKTGQPQQQNYGIDEEMMKYIEALK